MPRGITFTQRSSSQRQCYLSEEPAQPADAIAEKLYAAKPVQWRGQGELLQVPWRCQRSGLFLVIDLWSGFGGLIFALLSLGVRCIALLAEFESEARAVAEHNFPHAIHVDYVEDVCSHMVKAVIGRREFAGIIVGGGSPCQGNSSLNKRRQNWNDSRSQMPIELKRIVTELESSFPSIPVFSFLENVASMTPEVRSKYDELVQCSAVLIQGGCFGYTTRTRLWWGRGPKYTVQQLVETGQAVLPDSFDVVQSALGTEIRYIGPKPLPSKVFFEEGFSPLFEPSTVVAGQGRGAMYTFTREFFHPEDRVDEASPEAVARFYADNRRFPPAAYEEQSLLWKGKHWRTPYPQERAAMMGFPPSVTDSCRRGKKGAQAIQAQNSMLGNGFHLPSIMVFLFVLIQCADSSCSVPRSTRDSEAADLISRIASTVFAPGRLVTFPGIRSNEMILEDMRSLLPDEVPETTWQAISRNWAQLPLADLQAFLLFHHEHDGRPGDLGPQWSGPRHRASLFAALGIQRAMGDSTRGLDHLLQPGLGPEGHMKQALNLPSPFSVSAVPDWDMQFASYMMAVFGHHIAGHRRHIMATLRAAKNALEPVSAVCKRLRSMQAKAVATRCPVMIAFLTALLKWPDREQAKCYIHGFPIVGQINSSAIFRQVEPTEHHHLHDFLGAQAIIAVQEIESQGRPRDAEEIQKITEEEVEKGFCSPLRSKSEMDLLYGVGQWRPIPRFLVRQSCGKVRGIDDARRGQHNEVTDMEETIFTISADWVPEALDTFLSQWNRVRPGSEIPEFELATDDLPDAYRGCPVAPDHQCVSIVAVYCTQAEAWRYTQIWGLAYGLTSAVVSFNRFPTLLVAAARRLLGILCGAYFDDIVTTDSVLGRGSSQGQLTALMGALGSPPAKGKSFPLAQNRIFLGVSISLYRFAEESIIEIQPKSATRATIQQAIGRAVEDKLTAGTAAKLRGQCSWAAQNSLGRCGRIGLHVLKLVQYDKVPGDHQTVIDGLQLLSAIHKWLPRREIQLGCRWSRPIIIYSDASYEPEHKRPCRLGWVIFIPGEVAIGRSMTLPDTVMATWLPRTQQIFPAEAFAGVAVLGHHLHCLQGRDILWFVDNEAAASSLIRGSSRQVDVAGIVQCTHLLLAKAGSRCWFEWIDSKSNPSDGLSRDGISDTWTSTQGWELKEVKVPRWCTLPSSPAMLWELLSTRTLGEFAEFEHWGDLSGCSASQGSRAGAEAIRS